MRSKTPQAMISIKRRKERLVRSCGAGGDPLAYLLSRLRYRKKERLSKRKVHRWSLTFAFPSSTTAPRTAHPPFLSPSTFFPSSRHGKKMNSNSDSRNRFFIQPSINIYPWHRNDIGPSFVFPPRSKWRKFFFFTYIKPTGVFALYERKKKEGERETDGS